MALEVISASFLALVQDFGRYGLQSHGITHGGPMDEHAYLWANRLLQNHYNDAQIEISLGAFSVRFTEESMISVCGADLSITLNDKPLALWRSHFVRPGDVLKFVSPKSGLRSYLAIKGGFNIGSQLKSCATVMREGLGGLSQDGQKLQTGDVLDYKKYQEELPRLTPQKFIPEYKTKLALRFIVNESENACGPKSVEQFVSQIFIISQHIDRMGYKLSGKAISTSSSGIISQGISLGAIQLPKDGQPIVLMRDRQTMGGYRQLGCVAYKDIALLAQAMPGTEVKFEPVLRQALEAELVTYKRFFNLTF